MTAPTRVVAIGDVGSTARFHVGDEAMLESVVASSRRSQAPVEWWIVSANPSATAARLGVGTVPRLGLRADEITSALDDWDALIARPAAEWADAAREQWRPLAAALASADAVLIAGGGNLSRWWPEQVAERLALVRAAHRRGVPVVVSGQTLGPAFGPIDQLMVAEILTSAAAVGVRERASWLVAIEMGVAPERLVLQVDDAASLDPVRPLVELVEGGFIAATFNPFDALLPSGARAAIAAQLAAISAETGLPVVHVPHEGPLVDTDDVDVDAREHDVDVARSMCGPGDLVVAVPSPGEAAWWAAHAALVVSSRYHPVALAAAHGTPSLFVSQDGYTAVKGLGALEHVGLSGWAMPADAAAEGLLLPGLRELWRRRAEVRRHLAGATPLAERSQAHVSWVVDLLCGRTDEDDPGALDPLSTPERLQPGDSWSQDPRVAAATGPAWISHHRTSSVRGEADEWRVRFAAAESWATDMVQVIDRKDGELRQALTALDAALSSSARPSVRRPVIQTSLHDRSLGTLLLGDLRAHVEHRSFVVSMSVCAPNVGLDDRVVITTDVPGVLRADTPMVTPFVPIAAMLAGALSHDLMIEGGVDTSALGHTLVAVGRWAATHGRRAPGVRASERADDDAGEASARWLTATLGEVAGSDPVADVEALVALDWDHAPVVSAATRDAWMRTLARAQALGLPLVRATTNARALLEPTVPWSEAVGVVVVAMTLQLRPSFGSVRRPPDLADHLGAGEGGRSSVSMWTDGLPHPHHTVRSPRIGSQ